MRSEPAVSVPVAAGTMRAASAAAEPPLEPPAERSSAHGLPTWSVVPPTANSCVCRWPSRIMPCARSRAQTSQSAAGRSSSRRLEAVSGFALDGVEILEADRDAAQARQRLGAVGARRVELPRPLERLLLVDAHPGVDRARIALVAVRAVALADAREARARELRRGELPLREQRGGLDDAEVGGVHASARSSAAPSASTSASAPSGPTICRPTGRPPAVVPTGSESAGWPVTLNGTV